MGVYRSPSFASQGISNPCSIKSRSNFCINTTFFTDKMTENILDLASQDQQPMIIIGDLNIDPQRDSAKYQQLAGG